MTTALTAAAAVAHQRTETRLLKAQTEKAGLVLQGVGPVIEAPLHSALDVAVNTRGNRSVFTNAMVDAAWPGRSFSSATLWRLSSDPPVELARVGQPPALSASSPSAADAFARAAHNSSFIVVGPLAGASPRLGYVQVATTDGVRYGIDAESHLSVSEHSGAERSSPFADLNYSVFIGRKASSDELPQSTVADPPPTGRTATVVVRFGAWALTFVAAPAAELDGPLNATLIPAGSTDDVVLLGRRS